MGRTQGLRYYVPGLPSELRDEELEAYFGQYGLLLEATVAKDKGSGQSRGFGYVTMADEACRDFLLNSTHMLGGKEIRIVLTKESLVDFDMKKVHLNNCERASPDEIRDAFSQFGQVLDVHMPRDAMTGERRRYGFVTFASDEAFRQAVATATLKIGDSRIAIRPAAQTREAGMANQAPSTKGLGGKGSMDDWGWDYGGKGWGGAALESWGASGCWGPPCWGGADYGCWAGSKGGGCREGDPWGGKPLPGRPDFWNTNDGVRYYIPGLAPEATEEDLFEHFAKYGRVIDAIVVREKGQSSSRGFGYVKMAEASSRNQMINDTHSIRGKEVSVMLSKESLIGTNQKKVHIDNCAIISAEALRNAFAQFGPVLDVHTPKDHATGERKRFAFVTLGTDEALEAAIEARSIVIDDLEVPIKAATQTKSTAARMDNNMGKGGGYCGYSGCMGCGCGAGYSDFGNASAGKSPPGRADFWNNDDGGIRYYVPGLSIDTRDEDLFHYFSRYGKVLDAIIVKEKGSEISRGFGYVKMADAASQNEMINDKHTIKGKELSVMLSKESLIGAELKKIHIDHCETFSAGTLRDAFAVFGPVLDVHTPKDHRTGERKRFAFVTYGTDDALQAAISTGSLLVEGREVPIKAAAHNKVLDEAGQSCKGNFDGKGMGKNCGSCGGGCGGYFNCSGGWGPWDSYGKGCCMGGKGDSGCWDSGAWGPAKGSAEGGQLRGSSRGCGPYDCWVGKGGDGGGGGAWGEDPAWGCSGTGGPGGKGTVDGGFGTECWGGKGDGKDGSLWGPSAGDCWEQGPCIHVDQAQSSKCGKAGGKDGPRQDYYDEWGLGFGASGACEGPANLALRPLAPEGKGCCGKDGAPGDSAWGLGSDQDGTWGMGSGQSGAWGAGGGHGGAWGVEGGQDAAWGGSGPDGLWGGGGGQGCGAWGGGGAQDGSWGVGCPEGAWGACGKGCQDFWPQVDAYKAQCGFGGGCPRANPY